MALRAKVLQKKAEKFEAKQLQIHRVTMEQVYALEPLLQDVYVNRRPKPHDYETRRDLVRVFNDIAKEIYGNSKDIPVVVEFGSFVMDLFSTTSDLDLSVNFNTNGVIFPREKKVQTLRKFAKKLYAIQSKGHVYGVLPITTAKVPIVKVVDRGTGVECDISVENRDGILKSQIIHIISSIDERFQKLSFLMKTWAKANNINSSKDKTLNSLSIILLVAFHLQTRNPPILPPFAAIFKDGTDPETVVKSLPNFVNYGKSNEESLAELFCTLLIKLSSVEKLWPKGLCASTCEASWTSKIWDSKVACISVEDFTDRSQNVARAVGLGEAKRINKCIDISIRYVFSFLDGKIGGLKLKELLFGQDYTTTLITRGMPNIHPVAALPGNSSQSNPNRTVLIGKKRKQQIATVVNKKPAVATQHDAVLDPRNSQHHMAGRGETQQITAAVNKKPAVATQHDAVLDPRNSQHHMAGRGETYLRGWEGTLPPRVGSWGGASQPTAGSWGGAQYPTIAGWGGAQHPAAKGWGGAQQPTSGDWGGAQQPTPGGWGGAQHPAARGWGGAQQPTPGDWGRAQQPTPGGWGGAQLQSPAAGGWGGGAQLQSPAVGGWGGIQQTIAGSCGGTSYSPWTTNPNYRSL